MLCSGDMFKLYYRLVFVESSRLSWSTKVLTEAKNLGTFHIFKNSAIVRKCCYGFKLSSPVSPREPMTCADVIQLCRHSGKMSARALTRSRHFRGRAQAERLDSRETIRGKMVAI